MWITQVDMVASKSHTTAIYKNRQFSGCYDFLMKRNESQEHQLWGELFLRFKIANGNCSSEYNIFVNFPWLLDKKLWYYKKLKSYQHFLRAELPCWNRSMLHFGLNWLYIYHKTYNKTHPPIIPSFLMIPSFCVWFH